MLQAGVYIAPSAYESWFITDALSYEDLDYTDASGIVAKKTKKRKLRMNMPQKLDTIWGIFIPCLHHLVLIRLCCIFSFICSDLLPFSRLLGLKSHSSFHPFCSFFPWLVLFFFSSPPSG
jgi:hypothetical protein